MTVEYDECYDIGYDAGYADGFESFASRPKLPAHAKTKAAQAGYFTGYADGYRIGYAEGLARALAQFNKTGGIS